MGRSNDSSMRKRQQDDKNRKSNAGGKRSRLASDKVPNGDPVSQKKINHVSHAKIPGCVLTMGEGDTGQLGLGPDVMEKGEAS
ncbi:hypothetical protein LSAT2_017288 [Lamellibrachia satsuma]|nr:hypothetical protein LSAT2_017288 [Lamellibrachia satsuma]